MGFPSEVRDIFANRSSKNSLLIASPAEDLKARAANDCVQGFVYLTSFFFFFISNVLLSKLIMEFDR